MKEQRKRNPGAESAGSVAATVAVMLAALSCGLHAQPAASSGRADAPGQRKIRNALVVAQDYSSALGVAQQIVTELEPTKDPELPVDIMVLARVQGELKKFDDAEQNYLKAAKMLQEANGQFSATLVDPYEGLGQLYIKEREFPKALAALRQARYISQRNFGLFNLKQTPLIDDMTTAQLGLGDTVAARQLQLDRLHNATKELGVDSPKVVPYYYELATYYERSRLVSSAREQLEKVVTLREKHGGSLDPHLLEPLRAMTEIDMQLGKGDKAHDRLVKVLKANADYDARERALSEAVLGDWDLVHENLDSARSHYRLAYQTLAAVGKDAAKKAFSAPKMIDFVEPLSAVDRAQRRQPYSWGTIVLRFNVSAEGLASKVETVSMKPEQKIGTQYVDRIREAHFRPALSAGEPVATEHVEYRQSFRYYVDESKRSGPAND